MEPLIFYEKYLPGGSEPNRDMLIKEGTISLDGREDIDSAAFIENGGGFDCRLDGEHEYYFNNLFDMEMWRSGPSELSYRIMLVKPYLFTNIMPWELISSFETGESLTIPLPLSIVHDPAYINTSYYPRLNEISIQANRPFLPKVVDWDFGGLENIYVPGNKADPWRYQYRGWNNSVEPEDKGTNWGTTKDASLLLRVYEDTISPQSSVEIPEVNPNGYEIRNYKAHGSFYIRSYPETKYAHTKVLYEGTEYELPTDSNIVINLKGGQIEFARDASSYVESTYKLEKNVDHSDPTGIDIHNEKLVLQLTSSDGANVATKDILVQIVDDAPFVRGDATMDLTAVDAWTLGGDKLPLSYDYLKDVLYRSTDYNDWATGFKVTNCEGKYGSVGVFGDDGNPDDPASAPGSAYYMVDPDKIAFVAPGETVTEAVQYSYTDSDGDTANGVLNIVLKGTGLNPDEAIKITPRPGNVPTSGGDVPADNPYVPGNPDDPDRDLTFPVAGDYDPMNPNWGLAKDGQPLLRVFESGLPNGSEAGQRNVTAHGYLDIDTTVGLQSIVATTDGLDRYDFENNNMMTIPLDGGTLTLTQNPDENYLKYEFTLTDPVMHEPGNGINSKEQDVKLYATDNYGNEEVTALEVQIIDDVPGTIGVEYTSKPFLAWITGGIVRKVDNIFMLGADYLPNTDAFYVESNGKYGSFSVDNKWMDSLYLHYDIDYEYKASINSGELVTDTTKIIYTDSDGDSSEATLNYLLKGPGLAPRFTVNEAELSKGAIININDIEILNVVDHGKYGTVIQGDDGLWRYMLKGGIDSGNIQGTNTYIGADSFTLLIKEYDVEEPIDFNFQVDVIDSVPTFTAAQNRLAYDFGADNGPGAGLKVAVGRAETDLVPGVETMIAGQHGLLTLSADGSCHYTPNSDAAGIDRFDFTIIDSDGDRALASIEASVQDGTPQMAMSVQDADSLAAIAALGVSPETGALAGA